MRADRADGAAGTDGADGADGAGCTYGAGGADGDTTTAARRKSQWIKSLRSAQRKHNVTKEEEQSETLGKREEQWTISPKAARLPFRRGRCLDRFLKPDDAILSL